MRAALITIVLAALLGGGGVYAWLYYGGFGGEKGTAVAFIDSYGAYAEVADQVDAYTHLPGTGDNVNRQELQSLLTSILTENMEDGHRAELARLAYADLDALKKEVDQAQAAQAKLYQVLQDLDNASRVFHGIDLRTKAAEIVTMARARTELSARITSVLSETNDQTYAIITRILSDNGALTDAHKTEINDATDEAEKRFDTLKQLYDQLIAKKADLDRSFQSFAHAAI